MERAIREVSGVTEVMVSMHKAIVRFDRTRAGLKEIQDAIKKAGYSASLPAKERTPASPLRGFARRIFTLFGAVFGIVLFIVTFGEWLGLFEAATKKIPWSIWLTVIVIGGYPVFRNVMRSALRGRIISHTLMTVGMLAAIAVGQWTAAVIVVFFMRIGEYVESFTAERSHRALRELATLAPQTARVQRNGPEFEIPITEVRVGETVIVRPGEKIPVDGTVMAGSATVDQSTVTGESMPVEAGPGMKVFASAVVSLGSLRIRTVHVGKDTTFGRAIKLVEEAEGNRADVQLFADRFSGYFLPAVAGIALLTYLISRNALATAAVLVVVCSCSFALATPLAMIASIGACAGRGILIKGGKYLEAICRADVLLLDKTGTLTLGRPQITDIIPMDDLSEEEVLALAASAERYSEHPLAEAVRAAARSRGLSLLDAQRFEAVPGLGVRALIDGRTVEVGSSRMTSGVAPLPDADALEAQGKSLLFVVCDGRLSGVLAAADTLRPEVPEAIAKIRSLGITDIKLITGDNKRTAAHLSERLGIEYRADLLPEDKIAVVKEYQKNGHVVIMIGDGVNDAPALAQADVGIAMGAAGTDVAVEAAHIALMREDWMLVPELFSIARRTLSVVRLNLVFTALYNLTGLSLAAVGVLPLNLAAALQSIPDLGILGNSSRLLRQKRGVS